MLVVKPKLNRQRQRQCTQSHVSYVYCATWLNHKYIFRKLTTVNKMHTQEAPRQSLSVQEPSRRGKPAR